MGGASIWHWIVVGLLVMVFFGRGKLSEIMGDAAKGIKAFKKGMAEDDTTTAAAGTPAAAAPHADPVPRTLEHRNEPVAPAPASTLADRKLG